MAKLSRQRILDATHAAVVRDGHESLSLRSLARSLDVTAPALYDHFESKDALLQSVAEEGFRLLIGAVESDREQAIDRLRDRALRYVTFATANTELFRLMFMFRPAAIKVVIDDGVVADNELDAASDAYELGLVDLKIAVANGDLAAGDIDQMALILWVTVHGVATLALTVPELALSLVDRVIENMLAGMRP